MQTGPLVSVVMPSLNQVEFIGAAIDSVLGQDYPHLELIVADGGSTDGTVELLAARQSADARLHWQSGKDTGPAQAINSALKLVRGTVVGWLNSDDLYAPGAIRRAVTALQANPKWLLVYGHGVHVDGFGLPLHRYPTLPPATPITQFAEGCFICQPTVFARRTLWQLLGPLDQSLKAAFDFEYWLRTFSAFPGRIGFVDATQAHSRLHAGCITVRMRRTVAMEGMQVLARHLGSAPKEWLLTYVNELLADPEVAGTLDMRAHVDETLAVARQWLRQDDLPGLKLILKKLLV
ncbi:MAG: glycosyltransferase family 2 protein [Anaerolineales bacterium]|nr:glycosyltransferase family 2 protein [Anaerolineales bacterium]